MSATSALSDADRAKLVKVLGLLASPHPGERDAAGCAAVRLLQDRKLAWDDVIPVAGVAPPLARPDSGQPWPSRNAPLSWREAVRACQRRADLLSPWEANFIAGLIGRRSLSPKQLTILDGIAAKVSAAGGAR